MIFLVSSGRLLIVSGEKIGVRRLSNTNKSEEEIRAEIGAEYRQHLVLAEQKTQEDYDKSILSLSGGALGVSFAFIDKILQGREPEFLWMLTGAWILWGLSIAAVIFSFFCSRQALRKAIDQVDKGEDLQKPGGIMSAITERLNIISGVAFMVGIVLIAIFATRNLQTRYQKPQEETMAKNKDEGKKPLVEGYVPPTVQGPLKKGYVPPPPAKGKESSSGGEKKK